MKRKLCIAILFALFIAVTVLGVACKNVSMQLTFIVDGQEYKTIDTAGNEVIAIPQSPAKDGYTFDGWYWDEGTWLQPFTANSLLNVPLKSDMFVYAKFTEIHEHSLIPHAAVEAKCDQLGNETYYTCACGKIFADVNAQQELLAIPTIEKTAHTPSEWIVDNDATCTLDGSKHIECSICHTTLQTETIKSNGHTSESNWKIDRNADCITAGSKHLECSICHATVETETIPATGHTYSTVWQSDESGHWHVATCEHTNEVTAIEGHTYDSNYQCKVCHYQDTSLHGTAIATEAFDVDGETLYTKVPNSQTTFSFISAIQVAEDADFTVSYDLNGSNPIVTKTVSLDIGDNTYYVLVTNGKNIQLYTATIRRRPIYTVTFDTNGGTPCAVQQVEEDSFAAQSAISKTGYTLSNWNYDFTTPITQNTAITVDWTANEYTLTYDANGGELIETEYIATYDSAYTLAVPTREGHTFDGWYIDETKIVDADGQSIDSWTCADNKIVKAKWNVNSYTVALDWLNKSVGAVTGAGTYEYGSSVTLTAELNLGYNFIGWYHDEELFATELTYTFNMPAIDMSLTAQCVLCDEMSNFYFTSTSTECIITGVKDKTLTELIMPEYITFIRYSFDGYQNLKKVNYLGTIADWCNIWFDYNRNPLCNGAELYLKGELVSELVIPDNVTEIKPYAFYGCTSLTSIIFSNNVKTIGMYAFYNNNNLERITIGGNVVTVDSYAFYNCTKLSRVNYLGTIADWCNIGFSNVSATPLNSGAGLYLNNELVTELVIPETVESINDFSFYRCTGITDLVISAGVTSIGKSAFSDCKNLSNIAIPDSVTVIGNYVFSGCDTIEYIATPTTAISYIPKTQLKTVIITGGTEIGGDAFSNCSILTSVMLPDSVKTIGAAAFYKCSSLTKIILGNNVTSIGDRAFFGCSSLASIAIPDSVTSIGYEVFDDCVSLQYNEYDNALYLGNDSNPYFVLVKARSADITSCAIHQNTKIIYYFAFGDCTNLVNIVIPNGIATIGNSTFYNCQNLTEITIPNYVTSIGSNAFRNCSSLTSIIIPSGVATIGSGAFSDCNSLTIYCEVAMRPNGWDGKWNSGYPTCPIVWDCNNNDKDKNGYSYTVIDGIRYMLVDGRAWVIRQSSSLTDANIPEKIMYENIEYAVSTIYDNAFSGCGNLASIVIPNGVWDIGWNAFAGCDKLTMVTIPDSVGVINLNAFENCNGLTSIIILNKFTLIGDNAFSGCSELSNIYYNGTIDDWNQLSIGSNNDFLTSATRYYYSENEPTFNAYQTGYDGNYWHYVDGEPVIWTKE